MSNNETKLTAAIARLFSLAHLGEIKTRINPDIAHFPAKSIKSTEIYLEIENFSFGVEVVNAPEEKILYWVDGLEVQEETWAHVMDELDNGKFFLN